MPKKISFVLFLALCFSFSFSSCVQKSETASVSFSLSEESLKLLFGENLFCPENQNPDKNIKNADTADKKSRSIISITEDENLTLNISISGEDFSINEIFNIRPAPPRQTFTIDELPSEISVNLDVSINWKDIPYYRQKQAEQITLFDGDNIINVALKKAFKETDSFGTITISENQSTATDITNITDKNLKSLDFSLSSNLNPEKYEWFINGKRLSWTEKERNRFSSEELENISRSGTNSLVCIFGPVSGTELSENGNENIHYATKADFILSDEISDSKDKDEPEEPRQDEEKKDEPNQDEPNQNPSETDEKDEPENPALPDEKLNQISGNFVISLWDDITLEASPAQTQYSYISETEQAFRTSMSIKASKNGNPIIIKNPKATLYDGGAEYSTVPQNPFSPVPESSYPAMYEYCYDFYFTEILGVTVHKAYQSEYSNISEGEIFIQIADVNLFTDYQLVLEFTYDGKTYQATFDITVEYQT